MFVSAVEATLAVESCLKEGTQKTKICFAIKALLSLSSTEKLLANFTECIFSNVYFMEIQVAGKFKFAVTEWLKVEVEREKN